MPHRLKWVKEMKAGTKTTKAIQTTKDSMKAIETKAGVLKDAGTEASTETKEATCELFLQFAGKEYSEKELMGLVTDIWVKQLKHLKSELKDVKLYVKPEESAAYYVINKEITGKIEL